MQSIRYRLVFLLLSVLVLWLVGCSKDNPTNSGAPRIVVTPDLVYRQVSYGVNPPALWVVVRNGGGGVLNYTASIASGNTWIGLFDHTNSTATDSFIVNFQLGTLEAGTYLDTILIESRDASNSPYRLPVQLVITNTLQVAPPGFTFAMTYEGAEPPPQQMILQASSSTPVDMTLSHHSTWLSLDKTTATTPDTVTLTATGTGLSPGVYHDTVSIEAPTLAAPVNVPCSLVVASWLNTTVAGDRDLRDVHFIDNSRGFAVGALPGLAGGGVILHSTDGGVTWKEIYVSNDPIGGICFVDQNNGWAAGNLQVHRTRNASADSVIWTYKAIADSVNAVSFVDTSLGWVVGKHGVIFHTVDGGANWTPQLSPTSSSLVHVQFVSADSGWAVGNTGTIVFTSDGGDHWSQQSWGGSVDLGGLYFTNNLNGWAVGNIGTILHTTDAGATWATVTPITTSDLYAIWVSAGGRIWAVGAEGTILFTPDGSTWTPQPSGVTNVLKGVFFINDNIGWIVGANGVVLRTNGGGL